jgi:hypothetical protein
MGTHTGIDLGHAIQKKKLLSRLATLLSFDFSMLYNIVRFEVLTAESMKTPPKRQYLPIKLRVLAAQNNKILLFIFLLYLSFPGGKAAGA